MKAKFVAVKDQHDLGLMVDVETVNFVGDYAVVNALQMKRTGHYENDVYSYEPFKVLGVINRKYEAVSLGYSYLEFNSSTQKIIPTSENDFLVQVLYNDGEKSWAEYKHVRICDGKAMVMYEFPCYMNLQPTPIRDTWVAGNLIYNTTAARFVDNDLVQLLNMSTDNTKILTK